MANSNNGNSRRRKKGSKFYDKSTSSKQCRDSKRMKDEDVKMSSSNDPEWYAQTPQLAALAANIPFSQAAGTIYNLDAFSDDEGASEVISSNQVVPGIMTLSLMPVPTGADSPNSPLNIAATSVYSFVRHANSGSPQYNSPDLMLYCVAMGNVYSYIGFLQRVYGCMNLYANMNRYLPRALVEAQCVNYDNILANLPNFKYGIDSLIHKASSLAVPAGMTYFKRLQFLFSGVYAEGESVKDQLYMYIPYGFMQYDATAEETGGSLQQKVFYGANKYTYDALIKFGNSLLDPIISSEDMNIMSGDILKAYGDAGILKLAMLPDAYVIMPITDLTVLEQFQNAGFTGASFTSCKIIQSQKGLAASLVSEVQTSYNNKIAGIVNANKLITTILTQPGPGDVLERTRLMLDGSADPSTGIKFKMATEVPVGLSIIRIDPSTGKASETSLVPYVEYATATTQLQLWSALRIHCALENFKFHPMIYYFDATAGKTNLVDEAVDVDNYAVIDSRTLKRINEAALLSMFNTNSVARAY